jgi:hypothetical protein
MEDPYYLAQESLAGLKAAIRSVLSEAEVTGMTNAEIGRTLGIYTGHVGHEGHIPRTMLAIMEQEGIVVQNQDTKRWMIRNHSAADEVDR